MNSFKIFVLVFIFSFILIFLVDYLFIVKPKLKKIFEGEKLKSKKSKKKPKNIEVGELNYLVYKFKLDKKKLNWKNIAIMIPLINAFIMSFVVALLEFVSSKVYIKLLVAFVLLFALIYAIYEIYGRYLKKKQERECD